MNDERCDNSAERAAADDLPVAIVAPRRRWSLAWIVVALAAVFTCVVLVRSFLVHGPAITVQLEDGHGLKPGDKIRYRGIVVGEVTDVLLNSGGSGVVAHARLHPEAADLAVKGSQFWVVRPQVGLEGVAGIETIVGPRYLAVLPGDGAAHRQFVGLAEAPAVASIDPDDLEITLFASKRGSIRRGAPVMYRQVRVGTVLSTGLSGDGGAVEARVHVDRAYRQLVRPETKFWDSGGIDAQLRITGVSVRVPSLEALVAGGVSFATPPNAGDPVRTGHRFTLATEPDDEWLEWEPAIMVGSVHLPPGAPLPEPLRAKMAWREGRFWKTEEMRQGWVLLVDGGLLGPAELFIPPANAREGSVVLEVAGEPLPLESVAARSDHGVAVLPVTLQAARWPRDRIRHMTEPEECIAVTDAADAPLPISTARLSGSENGSWTIDAALPIDQSWHGAAVVARFDGKLIGVLLMDEDEDTARIAPLPAGIVDDEP